MAESSRMSMIYDFDLGLKGKNAEDYEEQVSLHRKAISNIEFYGRRSRRCTFTVVMNNGEQYTKKGDCEELREAFKSMQNCMMDKNKICMFKG